jgi:hypothetical protein
MGDYSRGHFEITLKKDAPKEVKEALDGFIKGKAFELPSGKMVYLGESAYHSEPTYGTHDFTYECGLHRYSLQFQIKYGCPELHEFAQWVAPHCVVDVHNRGFIGCSISEYADTVTTFIVKDGRIE